MNSTTPDFDDLLASARQDAAAVRARKLAAYEEAQSAARVARADLVTEVLSGLNYRTKERFAPGLVTAKGAVVGIVCYVPEAAEFVGRLITTNYETRDVSRGAVTRRLRETALEEQG